MKVRPLHDRIIVQRIEEGEQKVGGIIIPDTAKEKPQQGKVIAVGAGKAKDDGKRIALDVKEGDTILFGKYSGQEIKIDGEELLIMREDEVLAVARQVARRIRNCRLAGPDPSGARQWQSRLFTASSRARRFCAASTSWPTRSRSRSAPRAATSSSTRSSARPRSPRTASPSPRRSS